MKKGWTEWNVGLWLFNDEGLYNLVKDEVKRGKTLDIAAERIFTQVPNKTPDGAKYSKTNIRKALVGYYS